MAETADSESEIKLSGELLRCNICYDKFKQPRTLPCLHTFCEGCLQQHVDSSITTRNHQYFTGMFHTGCSGFACPTCREEFLLPAHGVLGFRHDFRIEQMQEFIQKAVKSHDTFERKRCQFCNKAVGSGTASSFCADCMKDICPTCTAKHKRMAIFAEHKIMETPSVELLQEKNPCQSHPSEDIRYLCLTCNEAICAICVMSDVHEEHTIHVLSVGLQKYNDSLCSQRKTLQKKMLHLKDLKMNLVSHEENVNSIRTKIAGDIKQRIDVLVDSLHKQEKRLLMELDQRCKAELTHINDVGEELEETLSSMLGTSEFVQSLLHRDMDVNMLSVYQDLVAKTDKDLEESLLLKYNSDFSLKFVASTHKVKLGRLLHSAKTQIPLSSVEPNMSAGDIKPETFPQQSPRSRRRAKMATNSGDMTTMLSPVTESQASQVSRTTTSSVPSLPELRSNVAQKYCHQNIPAVTAVLPILLPRLVAKFGRFGTGGGEFSSPRDICFLEDSQLMVVADTSNDRLQLFNYQGLLVRVIAQDRIKPWGVAATPAGNIAITDNLEKCVKVFDKLGNLLHKFGRFLCPCGIAVKQNGDIIVTDFFSTFVFVISKQGQTLSQFELRSNGDQHQCGASRIAVACDDKIIISDVSNGSVKIFDKQGKLLNKVTDSFHLLSPQGVAIDAKGNVLIADSMKQHVTMMDTHGHNLGILLQGKDHNLRDPIGLATCGKYIALTQMKVNQVNVYRFGGSGW